jgi:hypothetical protein
VIPLSAPANPIFINYLRKNAFDYLTKSKSHKMKALSPLYFYFLFFFIDPWVIAKIESQYVLKGNGRSSYWVAHIVLLFCLCDPLLLEKSLGQSFPA